MINRSIKNISILLSIGYITLACGSRINSNESTPKELTFTYTNPITSGIEGGIRDAQIFEDNGKYYLTGTSYPFWPREGKNPGVKIYSSSDLLNWKFEKLLIDRNTLDSTVWYLDRFWAPEIHKIKDKYYLLFNCQNETTEGFMEKGQKGGVAVANQLFGDYKVVTHDKPFMNGNDLTFFEDDDGKVYAFNNRAKMIQVAEVDLENMKIKTEPINCFPTGSLEAGDWDGIGIEGAYCIKHNGTYYLFYSSWSRGYEIGYATAQHPLGPWIKYGGNPIYGAQNENACKKNSLEFTGDPNSPWRAVGHNEIWKGPDGRLWLSCHGILKETGVPYLVIDPIDINDGVVTAHGPSFTKQSITYKQ
ncbi:family 43 glycosylhydrolase [Fulvivirgaceae bacterium BMA12]|uniref:Family 43 glycosylhydrolase n=1 Tax=Agaribacillus aureus TaxID=3051825 RepID=A0ABT8KZB3_9BACT|nr:family 43 glycosylhydrolase [Fulvivirgaceae bacterium BMA12]